MEIVGIAFELFGFDVGETIMCCITGKHAWLQLKLCVAPFVLRALSNVMKLCRRAQAMKRGRPIIEAEDEFAYEPDEPPQVEQAEQ